VDLHVTGPGSTAEERAAVDALLGPPTSSWDGGARDVARDGRTARGGLAATKARRDLLLPAIEAVQDRIGWVSRGALNYISLRLDVPPAEAWGVASFYHLIALEPTAPTVAHVCDDIACRAAGAEAICGALGERGAEGGALGSEGTWKRSPCLGLCEAAPAALVLRAGPRPTHSIVAPATAASVVAALPATEPAPQDAAARLAEVVRSVPQAGAPALRLLARVGVVDPGDLAAYRAHGGYAGLARAIELGAVGVVAELSSARLVGRGGAAFPTGRKWQAVAAQAERTRYVVCNADESEPGTFKDRVLMEWDPFAVLEGMTIAGFATGAERGFLYVRGEYPRAVARLEAAIDGARAAGLLGEDVAGAGFRFDVEIRRGAGAYICGEETALFNSIEGKRGEPRNKPPFPAEAGVFGKPTVVNNVETLVNVPLILLEGGAGYATVGSGDSTGPKLYCVSGAVAEPGLYEAPFGVTLRELLALAGGLAGGRGLRAILLGGAAGVFVGPDALDTPLTLEALRAIGATLGSGVVMVFDDQADLPDALRRIARFFRDESCGQCVPCRVGTVRQDELLHRLGRGAPRGGAATERALLAELGVAMRDASICGLGQTASSAIESAAALGLLEGGGS
jgi:NADH-quinone oxidoreductase subunit F